jgi:hypothetical protein
MKSTLIRYLRKSDEMVTLDLFFVLYLIFNYYNNIYMVNVLSENVYV